MSELAPFRNLDSGSEENISIRPFIFRSKLVSLEDSTNLDHYRWSDGE